MLTLENIKNAKLGKEYAAHDLDRYCRAVYGGIGWPSSKKPGFVVVLAMARNEQTGKYEICILDEFESPSYRDIIRHCEVLNSKYEPNMWISDTTNDSAEEIMYTMRDEVSFHLSETDLVEKSPLYPVLLDPLKELLNLERRRLFLKNSKLLNHLAEADACLGLGDVPSVEALAFAVIELLRLVESGGYIPSHTGDTSVRGDEGEFDHLLRPGATDPGGEYDEDEDEWSHTV